MFSRDNNQHRLLYLGLLLVPIFTGGEVLAFMSGSLSGLATAVTPVFIKAIKDVLMLLIGFVGIYHYLTSKDYRLDWLAYCLAIFIFILAGYSILNNGILISLIGIRAFLPLILVVLIVREFTRENMEVVAKIMGWLFAAHFAMQVIELFFAPLLFGVNAFGLSSRNPGLFISPATGGIFTGLCYYFLRSFTNIRGWRLIGLRLVSVLSVLLTASGSAFMLLFLMLAYDVIYHARYRAILVPAFGSTLVAGGLFVDALLGRTGVLEISLSTRFEIIQSFFVPENIFFSDKFGLVTNAAILQSSLGGTSETFTPDSIYAAGIGNLGLLGFVAFIWLAFRGFSMAPERVMFLMILFVGGAAVNMIELYPLNLLIPFVFKYFYDERKQPVAAGMEKSYG